MRNSPFSRLPAFVLAAALVLVPVATPAAEPSNVAAAIRENSLGVAHMHQQLPEKALGDFAAAAQAAPTAVIPVINQGLAYLYSGHAPESLEAFTRATQLAPQSPRAWYCLGLASFTEGKEDLALTAFTRAAQFDPANADTQYFLGTISSSRKLFDQAIDHFQHAVRTNPLYASAEFGLARAFQRSGKPDDARNHLKRFQQLTESKAGLLISGSYGEQGSYATAEDMPGTPSGAGPMIPVRFLPLSSPLSATAAPRNVPAGSGTLCAIDLTGSGSLNLVTPASATGLDAFHLGENGSVERLDLAATGLLANGEGVSCAVGDFDNDGLPDLALALTDRVLLFRNLGHGRFANVTAEAGIVPRNHPAGLTFVDFDHDGDLDLFITGSPASSQPTSSQPNTLWRNNGNGTFTEWTSEAGLGGDTPSTMAVLSDLNNDRAVDLLVTQASGAPTIYTNQREGAFQRVALYSNAGLPPARAIAIADFNKDGTMDVALSHTGAPGISLWINRLSPSGELRFERVALPLPGVTAAWGLAPIDVDNDGWIDLAALVATPSGIQLRVLRNLGPAGFVDISSNLGIAKLPLGEARSLTALDVDHDGAADLVIGRIGAPPLVLHNRGGSRNHALRVQLTGLADNKSAIGTKLEILAGGQWQKFEIAGASGYLGQGPPEILAGLGSADHVDVVRILWPTGVPQDELDVTPTRPLLLTELDRRGSSCPVLFAWDGTKYTFVSDVIGAGVVGHWTSPSGRNHPDSDEWTKVDGAMLRERGGLLSLRFGEPMEEINYIDQLRLVAVDHPADTSVFPDEKFLNDPPFASGSLVVASPEAHPPLSAIDDHGTDALPTLAQRDHHFLRDFTNLAGYAGFANPHTLTLDIGPWNPAHPIRLFLSGYVEYFSASSLYSAWQAGIQPHSPSVEAQLPDGSWKVIVPDMGFPAGLPRTIVADLSGKLPPGARRLRITTNLQIYWDQILADNGPAAPGTARQTELPLATAHLEFRGYPRQIEGSSPGDISYDYQSVSTTGPFLWQRGNYTRYGDVTPLLTQRDNRFVIFGTGEDVDAEFSVASLPLLPDGWTRDYFFYADGFVKDMDFHEALPFTVSELPFHGMSRYPYAARERFPEDEEALAWQLQWNDRVETGNRTQRAAFNYQPAPTAPITTPGFIGADIPQQLERAVKTILRRLSILHEYGPGSRPVSPTYNGRLLEMGPSTPNAMTEHGPC